MWMYEKNSVAMQNPM